MRAIPLGRLRQTARLGLTARGFLGTPIDLEQARSKVRQRVARRDDNFLAAVRTLVYGVAESPYRSLLDWAGCERGDLEAHVRTHGVDATLELLRDGGVYVTTDEFRGRTPIVRNGFELEASPADFDNPFLLGRGVGAATSGSSAAPRRVLMDWRGLAEDAADNLFLFEAHEMRELPLALWLSAPPGVAGIHALLVNAKRAHPPERWFTPVVPGLPGTSGVARIASAGLPLVARSVGMRFPRPEPVPVEEAGVIARWLAEQIALRGSAVVRTSASGAVRVAEAAARSGVGVEGGKALVGGEPLTPARRRALEAAGLTPVSFYGAAEIGLVGGGCARPANCDDIHIFTDRLGVTVLRQELARPGLSVESLLYTTLTLNAGVVLLNAEIGDHATLERRSCGCLLGELGLDVHVSDVRSHAKLTGEGMALLGGELEDAVSACVERAGGGPNDFQFWERSDDAGTRLVLAVDPDVPIDERAFVESVLEELERRALAGRLVAEAWRAAGTFELVRQRPQPNATLKLLPVARAEQAR